MLIACSPKAPQPRAEGIDPTFEGSPREAAAIANEKRLIAAHPDLAVRNGNSLTIRYDGEDLSTYTNDAIGCRRYYIINVLTMRDPSGKKVAAAEVVCLFGNAENKYVVLPTSDKLVVLDEVTASPDGKWLALGLDRADIAQGQLSLAPWPDVRDAVTFPAHCHDVKWLSADHFTATCWSNDGPDTGNAYDSFAHYFTADVTLESGRWEMRATQWLHRDTLKPAPYKTPLYHFTAATPKPPKL